MKIVIKRVKAEKIVVHTTNCPASSVSPFISALIGTLETATGVPNKTINAGNSFFANPKK